MKHLLLTTIAAVLLIGCGSVSGVYVSAQESESEAKAAQTIVVSSVVASNAFGQMESSSAKLTVAPSPCSNSPVFSFLFKPTKLLVHGSSVLHRLGCLDRQRT